MTKIQLVRPLGSFGFDAGSLALFRAGNAIAVPRKALELLAILSEREGELVTHEALQARLWGDAMVEERNLAQQIYVLRKALSADPSLRIENVPRRGYRLVAEIDPADGKAGLGAPHPAIAIRPPIGRWLAAAALTWAVALMASASASSTQPSELPEAVQRDIALGRTHWEARDDKSLAAARSYFDSVRKAIPHASKGYAGLAMVDAIVANHAHDGAAAEPALRLGEEEARAALSHDAADADALAALGLMASQRHHSDVAQRYFNAAIANDPTHVYAHVWRGIDRLHERDFENAKTDLSRAVSLEPTSKVALVWLSQSDYYRRSLDAAESEAAASLSIDPWMIDARWMQVYIAEARGEYRRALRLAQQLPAEPDKEKCSERDLAIARLQALAGDRRAARASLQRADITHAGKLDLASAQLAVGDGSAALRTVRSLDHLGAEQRKAARFDLDLDPRFAALRPVAYARSGDAG